MVGSVIILRYAIICQTQTEIFSNVFLNFVSRIKFLFLFHLHSDSRKISQIIKTSTNYIYIASLLLHKKKLCFCHLFSFEKL